MRCFQGRWGGRGGMARRLRLLPMTGCELSADLLVVCVIACESCEYLHDLRFLCFRATVTQKFN